MTEELASYFSDIIYSCKRLGEKTYFSFLFEHKSKYELPDLQLMTYTTLGYKKQEAQWKKANKALKNQKGKQFKPEKFTPTLIIPVLIYHGNETWQDRTFADLFNLPNLTFKKYIP